MVTIADVMAGKLLVQLGLVPADLVSSTLVAIADEDTTSRRPGDLVARLEAAGALPRAEATRARHLVALYEQVRVEGLFLQSLEKSGKVPKDEAHALLAAQEAPRRRARARSAAGWAPCSWPRGGSPRTRTARSSRRSRTGCAATTPRS